MHKIRVIQLNITREGSNINIEVINLEKGEKYQELNGVFSVVQPCQPFKLDAQAVYIPQAKDYKLDYSKKPLTPYQHSPSSTVIGVHTPLSDSHKDNAFEEVYDLREKEPNGVRKSLYFRGVFQPFTKQAEVKAANG